MGDRRDAGAAGPCERAWRAHFAAGELTFLARERLVMAADEPPLLLLPGWYGAHQREQAFAWAVLERYVRLFGEAELIKAVGWQDRLPEALAAVGGDGGELVAD